MTNKQPVPILTAHMASQFLHFGSWEMPDKLFDPFKASMNAIESGAAVAIDASELEALRRDAGRWRWLDSRTDHTWEKLSRMSHTLTRDYIDRAIAQEKAG